MKDKILFWLETGSPHLGIAKYLDENHDCELFTIVNTNKGKKFFQKQNIIKFIKTWYLHDNVIKSNKKPDLQYLSLFEKKYQINLWNIVYSDVILSQYNNFYKFTENEILSVLEQICKFFEGILEEINTSVCFNFCTVQFQRSSNRLDFNSGRTTCVSGSPIRTLNSIT